MNTLSDTDEGRARPSVWPVYVMAAEVREDKAKPTVTEWRQAVWHP